MNPVRRPTDPSVTAWGSFQSAQQQPNTFQPPPDVDLHKYRWGWNWFIGIHYGPIPVGLLIAIPLLIASYL